LNTTERDDQGSKVAAFFEGVDDMFDEMKWQKNYEDSHSSFGSARTCPSGVKFSSTGCHYQLYYSPFSTHSTLMDPLLILELISQVCV
jgi:hypothetical protein